MPAQLGRTGLRHADPRRYNRATCKTPPLGDGSFKGEVVRPLLKLTQAIDALNEQIAHLANWGVLLSCLISAANAMIRYAFDSSSNAWLEIQWYLFAGVVMLGASYTLNKNEHVRVDILYGMLSDRGQKWLDLIGTIIFLIPVCVVIAYMSWHVFADSWSGDEMSTNSGGLIRWPFKLLLPLGFALVSLQGLSEVIKRALALHGDVKLEVHYERPVQ